MKLDKDKNKIYNIVEKLRNQNQERRCKMSANILEMDKIISISSKNQITIPEKLMEFLGFGKEAKIKTDGNSLNKNFSRTDLSVRNSKKYSI